VFFSVARPYQDVSEINGEILANSALLVLLGTGVYYSWLQSLAYRVVGLVIYFLVLVVLFFFLLKSGIPARFKSLCKTQ
jgi:hypothetical protein